MKCCHPHVQGLGKNTDERFDDDDFTQAALRERRMVAAHAHAGALVLSLIGGILLFGLCKSGRRCAR
ncbi:MAG: hypothetical protein ACYC6C_04545 [Coriobacteriia bacterium]